jgi:hypothetical protein
MTDRPARFRSAADKSKALHQYQELKRSGRVAKAVVVAEMKDGSFEVLGQELTPREIGPLLFVAAEALVAADADRKIVKLRARVEPAKRGERVGVRLPDREITRAPDGVLIPPEGENFMSCGECAHPSFHVLNFNDDDGGVPARLACSHCGNEIKLHRVMHRGGTA